MFAGGVNFNVSQGFMKFLWSLGFEPLLSEVHRPGTGEGGLGADGGGLGVGGGGLGAGG